MQIHQSHPLNPAFAELVRDVTNQWLNQRVEIMKSMLRDIAHEMKPTMAACVQDHIEHLFLEDRYNAREEQIKNWCESLRSLLMEVMCNLKPDTDGKLYEEISTHIKDMTTNIEQITVRQKSLMPNGQHEEPSKQIPF